MIENTHTHTPKEKEISRKIYRKRETHINTNRQIHLERERWRNIHKYKVNFINILRTNFSYERHFSSYILALSKNLYEKFARFTLMKLTSKEREYSEKRLDGKMWKWHFTFQQTKYIVEAKGRIFLGFAPQHSPILCRSNVETAILVILIEY